ncbi:S-methylmethionine--homocysteine S-methyltransferase BHMT2-like [Penaeus japonicus]|uniref:S-methylmethionine--homocysteine S-methyltransferase BHMT2-like n=1 Tax=Penaeus japonicus TaxID=27405 RepID=UPI001C70F748|nr:S-methylmethionine--homocysteine S-methyltransferase BHMT2-like [Penaeus japonicus]
MSVPERPFSHDKSHEFGGKGLLERLRDGVVVGDGGYIMALERRGFVDVETWMTEAVLEHPEAVKQLHREFLLAGSDVLQACTYSATDDKLVLKKDLMSRHFSMIGVNCLSDPVMTIDTMRLMKEALDAEGLRPLLMTQPNGFFSTGTDRYGYRSCPEYPLALESGTVSRFDVYKYARAAYDLGVRYIGGCCGFQPYHIRAIGEELAKERGKLPPSSAKHKPWGEGVRHSASDFISARVYLEHWKNLVPPTGQPGPPSQHFEVLCREKVLHLKLLSFISKTNYTEVKLVISYSVIASAV